MTISVKPLMQDDFPLLLKWLDAPHVKRWWKPHWTAPVVEALQNGEAPPDWMRCWRIDYEGRAIGYAHDYDVTQDGGVWDNEPDIGPGVRGIDLLIGEAEFINRKLGREAMRVLTKTLFETGEVERTISDPHPDNWPAIIAFKKVGYRERGRRQLPSGSIMLLTAAKAIWKG